MSPDELYRIQREIYEVRLGMEKRERASRAKAARLNLLGVLGTTLWLANHSWYGPLFRAIPPEEFLKNPKISWFYRAWSWLRRFLGQ